TLKAEGKVRKNSVEEALQIDIATPLTAPGIAKAYGKKFTKGDTCKNIKVLNNTITSSRGICANYASREKKYRNKFHDKITIIGNKVTGKSAEGVALFNTLNSTVRNNTIVSNSKRKKEAYSIGLNILIMGSSTQTKKATVTVQGNTIRGGRQGMQIASKTSSKYKKAVVKKNKLSASAGQALLISPTGVSKASQSGNKK
ncbi:MAG: right-handed parallel beta-helix repeat-containing protein, partial [Lachnospiraceae bacterium]|nr:right-handed parallel beta-helix repeat-containing protein [Lachnospiraceae bacterium]